MTGPMKIAITGASGLIGTALTEYFRKSGHTVIPLVRNPDNDKSAGIFWDPEKGAIDRTLLEHFDAVIHLSGENLAERWSAEKKKKIRDSRIVSTKFLTEVLLSLNNPPKVAVLISAIGLYGDRGDEEVTEDSPMGKGFLAELVHDWEEASSPLENSNIRTIKLRAGVVLSSKGGALAKMLPAFKSGVGGRIGSGKQYLSWITLEDFVRLVEFAILNDSLSGPVNAVTPNPVTNAEFTEALAGALHRPNFTVVPEFAIKMLYGEMGKETILSSIRAVPSKLEKTEFKFLHPEIGEALKAALK